MKRDDDFIRSLLFEIEQSEEPYLLAPLKLAPSPEELKRYMHAKWLSDAGLLIEEKRGVFRITNQGHDYLNAIRNDNIWNKTKYAASSAGGVGLGMMKDIAVSYVKQELSDRLGIKI